MRVWGGSGGTTWGSACRQRDGRCATENSEEPEPAPQVPIPQRLNPTSSDRPQAAPRPTPDPHRAAKGHPRRPSALRIRRKLTAWRMLRYSSPVKGKCCRHWSRRRLARRRLA